MRKIILYGRRNTGLLALSYLWSKYIVRVISDDEHILEFSRRNNIEIIDGFSSMGDYDLFICVHGNKIIPKEFIIEGKMINIHPCLNEYVGHNPIKRYIANKGTVASVSSHFITEEVDAGELIYTKYFYTGEVSSYESFYNIAYPFYLHCLDNTMDILKMKNEVISN
jgi:methionyl-tRNA formyltransferase